VRRSRKSSDVIAANPSNGLPPQHSARLSKYGWLALIGSLLLGGVSVYIGCMVCIAMYIISVAVGFLVGLPGGMHYQADVDAYFASQPQIKRSDLPWPEGYEQLSRSMAWRYTIRGLPFAICYGILMPIFLLLAGLERLRILKASAIEALWHRP
jgi:hypothetical protein